MSLLQSNIRRERRQKPDPPCVVCRGNGRVECYDCNGRGRTNYVDLEMLPKGKWPKWCRNCGGSGMNHCSRCLGTGEYRYIMGFGLMHRQSGDNEHGRIGGGADRRRRIRSADDLLVNDEECL
nr:protein EMBRYO SAC DEVELOPMENT ARREST 3, chloroplastic [Ipomoea batatas]